MHITLANKRQVADVMAGKVVFGGYLSLLVLPHQRAVLGADCVHIGTDSCWLETKELRVKGFRVDVKNAPKMSADSLSTADS